jgi:hypothetical protein
MAFTEITSSQIASYVCTKNVGKTGLDGINLDETNGNTIPYNSNMAFIIFNDDGTNANTVTIASAVDNNGRAATTAYTIAAGKFAVVPPLDSLYSKDGLIELTISGTGAALKLIPVVFLP